jgi:hypothetical protein
MRLLEHRRLTPQRPLPAWLGFRYWHVAYRFYVRYYPPGGEVIEGVYFVRSDCNSPLMTAVGNWLTDFHFHTAGIEVSEKGSQLQIAIRSPEAPADVTLDREKPPRLPAHSVFGSLEEAAAFLKYKPFGISWERRRPAGMAKAGAGEPRFGARDERSTLPSGGTRSHPSDQWRGGNPGPGPGPALPGRANVVAITRDEAAWKSRLIEVVSDDWKFLEGRTVRPEICYEVEPINYQWNRGRIYPNDR